MTDTTIDAVLKTAVAEAIEPVNYKTISQAICRSQNGAGQCLCDRGVWRKCHAQSLYGDMALAVLTLMKAGRHNQRNLTP